MPARPHAKRPSIAIVSVVAALLPTATGNIALAEMAIVSSGFIYDEAPFPSCHASTIAEGSGGLVAAWFGGKEEGDPSVGIWCSRQESGKWTAPQEVADGVSEDGTRYPCWNPVLHQATQGPLILFYKVGPSPRAWWGMQKTSADNGRTWSEAVRLPDGILGPIKNKPVEVEPGVLLCGSSTEHDGWRVHMERVRLDTWDWSKTEPLNDGQEIAAIQPTILQHGENRLQILLRTRQRRVGESWSDDGGHSWSELTLSELPNPSSGIDAVTLADGRHVLVYNPIERGRSPLVVGASDDGKDWEHAAVLEAQAGEYSYPAVIQSADGRIHTTYTFKRERIKHVVLDPGSVGRK